MSCASFLRPLVSIIIPSYNCLKYLEQSIESCLAQSYPNCEIIVVDDGSTDNTKEALLQYQGKIVYHYQENIGLAGARNTGHSLANGDYVAWLDADDIAHPDRISIQMHYLENNPETVLVCSNFNAFDEGGGWFENYANNYYRQLSDVGGIEKILPEMRTLLPEFVQLLNSEVGTLKVYSGHGYDSLIWGNFIHPPTVFLRKSAIKKAGLLRTGIPTQEDWEYITRLSKFGKIAFIDFPLLEYRIHDMQLSTRSNAVLNAKGIIEIFENNISHEPELLNTQKVKIKQMRGSLYFSAAYALTEIGAKKEAIEYLLKSIKFVPLNISNYKLIAKLIF